MNKEILSRIDDRVSQQTLSALQAIEKFVWSSEKRTRGEIEGIKGEIKKVSIRNIILLSGSYFIINLIIIFIEKTW